MTNDQLNGDAVDPFRVMAQLCAWLAGAYESIADLADRLDGDDDE